MAQTDEVTAKEILGSVVESVVEQLHERGALNQTHLRNIYIRREFRRLVNKEKKSTTEAITILTQKVYECKNGNKQILTEDSIQKIVWPHKE